MDAFCKAWQPLQRIAKNIFYTNADGCNDVLVPDAADSGH